MAENQRWQAIPTQLDLVAFEQFVLPHLSPGSGPAWTGTSRSRSITGR